ncbi:MAG: hypothetical protein K1X85_12955 [Ignavibacteria bacterium]|nr:hypothetical protein [Ignavibacteria bacterium]
MNRTLLSLAFVFLSTLSAQSSSVRDTVFKDPGSVDPEILSVIETSLSAVDGDIVKAEKRFSKERVYWLVVLITNSGGELRMHVDPEKNSVLEITDDEGPFDYEVIPGKDLVSFSEARKSAESVAGSRALKWKLVEAKSGMQYHFWMFTKGGAAQFKLDAVTGERIMKKQGKKKRK